jgi:integrase/recombinase XerD
MLRDQLAAFLEHEKNHRYSPCTLKNHKSTLTTFVAWLETQGVVSADRLGKAQLDAWLRHLNSHCTPQGLPIKAQTLNLHIINARRFLEHLAARGIVPVPLASAVECVKAPRLLPQGVLTHAQARKLLGGVQTSTPEGCRNRAMIELLYSSGLRSAELLGLDVGDVDFEQATAIVTGKGSKQRVVPIGRTALRFLESYLKAMRPFMVRNPAERAMFLNRQGGRLRYNAFCQIVATCAGGSGVEKVRITAHTFRRSCATELLRGGANMYHVKDLLGHESLNTLRHYAKLTIVDLKKEHRRCHPRERDGIERGLLDGGRDNE